MLLMEDALKHVIASFEWNLDKIETLLSFDEVIQQFCLAGLKRAKSGLDRHVTNPNFSVDRQIEMIERIRQNDSLKPSYQIVYNQCIVLLVSYFSSAVEDIFKKAFSAKLKSGNLGKLATEEFKISVEQLVSEEWADVFVQKKDDINFQDMKSTLRSFENYLGCPEIKRTQTINNIILAQAMRHCIVHNGCAVNSRTMNQLRDATPRTIKTDICDRTTVQFNEDEVRQVKADMLSFVRLLSKKVLEALVKKE